MRDRHAASGYRAASKMLWITRQRAKQLGYAFDLDRHWFIERLVNGHCEVSGIPFDFATTGSKQKWNPYRPSIDRIDSNGGYTKDNCRLVVSHYNFAKGQWSDSDFIKLAKAVIDRGEKNEK